MAERTDGPGRRTTLTGGFLLSWALAMAMLLAAFVPTPAVAAAPLRSGTAVALAPTNLVVYASDRANLLSWNAPSKRSVYGTVAGFNIYRSRSLSGPFIKVKSVTAQRTSYVDSIPEDASGVYYYRVSAVYVLRGRFPSRGRVSSPRKESAKSPAVPNLYVKIVHRFASESSGRVVAANGKITFEVPAGALSEPTTISITELESAPKMTDAKPVSFPFEFQPSGLAFDPEKAPTVKVPYYLMVSDLELKAILGTAVRLYYYDDDAQAYRQIRDDQTSIDPAKHTMTARLIDQSGQSHFTTYWTGAKTNPHGATATPSTSYCGICHGLHISDPTWMTEGVCVQCHGNTNSSDPPAGAGISQTAPNIQAEFLDCADQDYGGGGGGGGVDVPYSWTQTTQTDWDTDNLTQTVTTNAAGGQVLLDAPVFGRSDEFNDASIDSTWTAFENVTPNGSRTETGGYLELQGGGGSNGFREPNTSEEFRWESKVPFTGDATFTAKINSLTGSNVGQVALLMVRSAYNTNNATFFAVGFSENGPYSVMYYRDRVTSTQMQRTYGAVASPTNLEVRITRTGNTYRAYEYTGGAWSLIGSHTFGGSGLTTPYYGLVVSNGTNALTNAIARFDYIRVEPDGGDFYPQGWVGSTEIAPSNLKSWGQLSWNAAVPAQTSFKAKVSGWNGASWTDLATATASPYDLSGISSSTYTKLKLSGELTTTAGATSPVLADWTVTATRTAQLQSWTQTTQTDWDTDTLTQTVTTSTAGGEVILDGEGDRSDEFSDTVVDASWTPWSNANQAGTESENGSALVLTGGGGTNGLRSGRTSDEFRYLYKAGFSGNATWTVEINSVTGGGGSNTYAAHLMVRQSPTTADSTFFAVGWYQNSGATQRIERLYRTSKGGSSTRTQSSVSTPTNTWVRITKLNNDYSAYVSTTAGASWTQVGTAQTIAMGSTPAFGLAVSNGTTTGSVATGNFEFIRVEPDPLTSYLSPGTVMSTEIAPSGLVAWGQLTWGSTEPANTNIDIGIQGWNGSTWTGIATDTVSPYDLSGINPATYTKLRLIGLLTTTQSSVTPWLNDWTVTAYGIAPASTPSWSRHPVPESSMRCDACHTPHDNITTTTDQLRVRITTPSYTPWGSENYRSAYTYSYTATPLGNEFCWGCHGAQANYWSVSKGLISSTDYYNETRGDHKTGYNAGAAHDLSLPASGTAPRAWVPPTSALGDNQGSNQSTNIRCENCHYHHGTSQAKGLTGYRLSYNYTLGKEETLCLQCHNPTWAAGVKDLQTAFNKTSRHRIASQSGRHDYNEDRTAVVPNPALGGSNRHVECADCHNTHQAQLARPATTSAHVLGTTAVGPSLVGVWGVQPTWTSNYTTPTAFSVVTSSSYEWQICLKCHSYYAYGTQVTTPVPSGGPSTDIGRDFNPNNSGGHAVTTRSRTTGWGTYAGGWASSYQMTCSDCHSNDSSRSTTVPAGPHGSTNKWLLRAPYSGNAANGADGSSMLCFMCHDYNTYYGGSGSSAFATSPGGDLHTSRSNHKVACSNCHAYPPHGGRRRSMLINYSSVGYLGSDVGLPNYNPASASSVMYLQSNTAGGLPARAGWSQGNCGCGTGGGH